jgi:hypothetical protein
MGIISDLSGNGDDDTLHSQEIRGSGVGKKLRRLSEATLVRGQRLSSSDASKTLRRASGFEFLRVF